MCGIIGTYHRHSFDKQQKDVFYDLLMAGRVRGYDGTGIFNVSKGEVSFMKGAHVPEILMFKEGWKEFWEKAINESNIIVGHHRAATKGVISDENAHPFQHGHITMVHNGTLDSGVKVEKDGVDSDALCKMIADVGWKQTFETISGPYACVWWDSKEKKLFFIKNYHRPLAICKYNGNHFWASEEDMLEWAIARRYSTYKRSDAIWYTVKEEHIHWLDPHEGTQAKDDVLKIGEKATKKYFPVSNYDYYRDYYGSRPTTSPPASNVVGITTKTNNDWSADISLIEEHKVVYADESVKWKYIGLTDDCELVYGYTLNPLLDWHKLNYWGKLLRPVTNNKKIICDKYGEEQIFYELDMDSLVIITKDKKKNVTLDGYHLSDEQIQKFIRERCVTCDGPIGRRNINKILTHTDDKDKPTGLFCVVCSRRHHSTYAKYQQEVKH